MEDFVYSPFKDPEAQIRLVEIYPLSDALEPYQQQQELRCAIKTVNLHDKPEYTALSYSWGPPNRRSRLIVDKGDRRAVGDDATIRITKSLEIALLHLRDSVRSTTLWIDQLCINQDDLFEKSVQVPLMKTIYENAVDVLVWLGPARDESHHLLKILDEVGKQATKAERLYGSDFPFSRTQTYNATLYKLRRRSSLGRRFGIPTESLRSFVQREWWTRVWVVQEISVAASVIFACGDQRITYERLRNALRWYSSDVLAKSKIFQSRHWLVKLCTFQTLLALQKAPYDSAALQMLTMSYRYKEFIVDFDLLRILDISHVARGPNSGFRLQATDHKDKIYGLLGLIEDGFKKIQTDYRKEVSAVYIDAAQALLKDGYVDMLWYCQFPKSDANGSKLPTWTPDWSGHIHAPYGSGFSITSRPFAASGKRIAEIGLIGDEERHVILKGVSVDEVVEVGQLWGEVPGLSSNATELNHSNIFLSRSLQLKNAMPFLEELDRFFDHAMDSTSRPDAKTIEEARWRTPLGDREMEEDGGTRRATAQSRDTYMEIYRRIEIQKKRTVPSPRAPQKRRFPLLRVLGFLLWTFVRLLVGSLLNLIFRKKGMPKIDDTFTFPSDEAGRSYVNSMEHMYGRRPFRTRHGHVGLGPAGMREKDKVCILFGTQVPYVLRPDENSRFQLVGETYIHGIMEGEFLEEKHEEKEFTLF